jgi:hypothetical protein
VTRFTSPACPASACSRLMPIPRCRRDHWAAAGAVRYAAGTVLAALAAAWAGIGMTRAPTGMRGVDARALTAVPEEGT